MYTPDAPAPYPAGAATARGGFGGFLSRAEAWLDAKGRGAWIAAMVLGFIFFWPIGLALVFYITFTNRWSKDMFGKSCRSDDSRSRAWKDWADAHHARHHGGWSRHGHHAFRSSGNAAFDAYKTETLRRLEEEQTAFEEFLDRLRKAKDKTEFDAFMEDRARSASTPVDVQNGDVIPPAPPQTPPPGPVPQGY